MTTSKRFARKPLATALALSTLMVPALASAYVGPGAGLSLLTALWGIIAAIGVAVLFVVMWPIRRLRRRRKAEAEAEAEAADESANALTGRPADDARENDDHRV